MKSVALISILLGFGQSLWADKYKCEFWGIYFKAIDDGGIIDLPGHTWAEDEKITTILDLDVQRMAQWEIEFSVNNPRLRSRKVFVFLAHDTTNATAPYQFSFYLAETDSGKTIQSNWIEYKTLPDSILFSATNRTILDGYFDYSIDCTRADQSSSALPANNPETRNS